MSRIQILFRLLPILLLTQTLFATEENILTPDEVNLLNTLQIEQRPSIKHQITKLKYAEDMRKKVLFEDIKNSHVYKVLLQKNTPIININDDIEYLIPIDSYVKIFHMTDNAGFNYILGNDEIIKFKVAHHYVVNINDITDMDIKPSQYKPHTNNKLLEKIEHKQPPLINHQINVHGGFIYAPFIKDIVQDNQTSSISSQLDYSLYIKSASIIEIGPTISFQNISSRYTLGSSSLTTISIGPKFRFQLGQSYANGYFIQGSFVKSFYSQMKFTVSDTTYNVPLSSNSIQLGLEKHVNNFLYGSSYQRMWFNIKENNQLDSYGPNLKYADAIDIYLGLQI